MILKNDEAHGNKVQHEMEIRRLLGLVGIV